MHGRSRTLVSSLALVCGVVVAATLKGALAATDAARTVAVMSEADREQVNRSAFATILGELRTSSADLMWIKTERYMHLGIGYAPHMTRTTQDDGAGHVHDEECDHDHGDDHDHADGDDHAHEHDGMEALIPVAQKDYRGFVGTLHRNVHPWQPPDAPHREVGGEELVPWFRVLTMSNPHHTRGYVTGTWWLMAQEDKHPGATEEALGFIDEGIRNNPEQFDLHLMRGRVLMKLERWVEACDAFREAARLAMKVRPEGGEPDPSRWSEWEEDDFSAAVHFVPAITLRRLGDMEAAREALDWAESILPGDPRLQRLRVELEQGAPEDESFFAG